MKIKRNTDIDISIAIISASKIKIVDRKTSMKVKLVNLHTTELKFASKFPPWSMIAYETDEDVGATIFNALLIRLAIGKVLVDASVSTEYPMEYGLVNTSAITPGFVLPV